MHAFSGTAVDLLNFTPDMVVEADISHALIRNIRFNGHIDTDFTVYEHSMIGAYLAGYPRLALEALLHDTGEAYVGDIILPMKECFPEIAEFEDKITAVIFDALWPGSGLTDGGIYKKSPDMVELDRAMAAWESLQFRSHHPFTQNTWDTRERWLAAYDYIRAAMLDEFVICGEAGYHALFWDWYEILLDTVTIDEEIKDE